MYETEQDQMPGSKDWTEIGEDAQTSGPSSLNGKDMENNRAPVQRGEEAIDSRVHYTHNISTNRGQSLRGVQD